MIYTLMKYDVMNYKMMEYDLMIHNLMIYYVMNHDLMIYDKEKGYETRRYDEVKCIAK